MACAGAIDCGGGSDVLADPPVCGGFASLFYLVPVVTALLAFILFGERLDAVSILGMLICAGGVVLANRGARQT
jgi:dipeptide/tripeptide permease